MTDDTDTPTLDDALDGIQTAIRYCEARDLDEHAWALSDHYQDIANDAPTHDVGEYDPDDAPRSDAATYAQASPERQQKVHDLAEDARKLFDSCPECGYHPIKEGEYEGDTFLKCENDHVWKHQPEGEDDE